MHRSPPVRPPSALAGTLLLALALLAAGRPGLTRATPGDPPILPPPDSSLSQAPRPAAGLAQARPKAAKLDSALAALAAAPRLAGDAPAPVVVHIAIAPADRPAAQAAVEAAGGAVQFASADGATLQARVPVTALGQLAALPQVQLLRTPAAPAARAEPDRLSAHAISEGLAPLGVAPWHAAGISGQGQCIGIIDNGFQGYAGLLGGELPPADRVTYRDFAGPASTWPDTPYGAAAAEVIHAIAPDARLFLARISNDLEFAQAARWMQDQCVTVISTSLIWYNRDPGDGTGFLADVVARSTAAGILWVTPAQDYRLQHWGGNAFDGDGDGYLGVAGPLQINRFRDPVAPGEVIEAHVRWSDWAAVDQDVELVVARWNGLFWEEYDASVDLQNGRPGQRPAESLWTTASGPTTYYGVALRRFAVDRPLNVDVFTFNRPFADPTPERSLANLGDAPAALTVGGVAALPPYALVETSGQGPTNGAGGARDGGLRKPDAVSFVSVSTRTYGAGNFWGAGAATAHAAGAAALLRGADPGASPAAIKDALLAHAVDRWLPGWDTRTGYGQLALGAPPNSPRAVFDFSDDPRSDILWRSDILGETVCYEMDGTRLVSRADLAPGVPAGWQIVAAGDHGGDDRTDLVAVDPATRRMRVLITGGTGDGDSWQFRPGWVIAGSADFNADGRDDLLFRNTHSGLNAVGLMRDGAVALAYPLDSAAPRWQVAGVGDLDGDGAADILWRSSVSGRVQTWLLSGRQVAAKRFLSAAPQGPGWQVAGLADVDGDHSADLLWYHLGDGAVWADLIRAGQFAGTRQLHAGTNPAFRIVAVADYNADGRADILWRDMLNGGLYLYLRDGATILGEGRLPGFGLGWSVVGMGSYDGARLPLAGGPSALAAAPPALSGGAASDSPAVGDQASADDPHAPDPGTPEGDAGEAVGSISIPADATVEQITGLTLGAVTGGNTLYLPLLVR